MKVLISALACEPDRGSEPEVGFRAMLAAAEEHEVWVLTLPEAIPAIERQLADDPRAGRIHLVSIPFRSTRPILRNLTSWEFHGEYDRWQRRAVSKAHELDERIDFDVVHHVTLASYWTRAGVATLDKPLVWGPIGGGVDPPMRLLPGLGVHGIAEATARIIGRPVVARLPPIRRTQRRAAVILVQNPDTGRRLHGPGEMKLLSNALAVDLTGFEVTGQRTRDLLVVGRLVPWKAPILALRSLRHLKATGATLHFFGDGPEQARLERAASAWNLEHRVRFEGWVSRPALLSRLATAGALIHPAVHEEAGLCIAEALSLGTPVVALDHGGPAQIVAQWRGTRSALISPSNPEVTARRIAVAVDAALSEEPPTRQEPLRGKTSFERELLAAYQIAARANP
jgi:glycosyltransferase involved in cell wall biosynthesis